MWHCYCLRHSNATLLWVGRLSTVVAAAGLSTIARGPGDLRAVRRHIRVMTEFNALLAKQDGLVTREQALGYVSEGQLAHRLGRTWAVVLPGIYAVQTGPLTLQQRLRAGLLFGGPKAQITDVTALTRYRARYLPDDERVHVLTPASVQRQSRDFVVVKRSFYLPEQPTFALPGNIPLTPINRALADFALRYDGDEREVRAVLASAVQRGKVSVAALRAELEHAAARGRKRLARIVEELEAGVRAVPEGDIRTIVSSSKILPTPLYNCLLELPCGRCVSPDLLIEEAALVHESNGRGPHFEDWENGEDPFESLQERHDAMTTGGLTVLHNSKRQIEREGARILRELETCFLRDAGKGLPPGVRILRRGPA